LTERSGAADLACRRHGRQLVRVAHRVEVGDLAVDTLDGENALKMIAALDQHNRRRVADGHFQPEVGHVSADPHNPAYRRSNLLGPDHRPAGCGGLAAADL
jgi:hypothetical protein